MRFLDILPGDRFASLETSRMTILFFAISGLDVLGSLEKSLNEERKREIVDWIYSLQVETGFLGSTFLKIPKLEDKLCDGVHIAMTYTALATLVILGKDILYVHAYLNLIQKQENWWESQYGHWSYKEGSYIRPFLRGPYCV